MREYIVWVVHSEGYRGMFQWVTLGGDVFPGAGESAPFETYEGAVNDVLERVRAAMLAEPERA
jgi:hypothetical protein